MKAADLPQFDDISQVGAPFHFGVLQSLVSGLMLLIPIPSSVHSLVPMPLKCHSAVDAFKKVDFFKLLVTTEVGAIILLSSCSQTSQLLTLRLKCRPATLILNGAYKYFC